LQKQDVEISKLVLTIFNLKIQEASGAVNEKNYLSYKYYIALFIGFKKFKTAQLMTNNLFCRNNNNNKGCSRNSSDIVYSGSMLRILRMRQAYN